MAGEGSMAHAIKSQEENKKLRVKAKRQIFTRTTYLRSDIKPYKKSKPLSEEEKQKVYEKYVIPLKKARNRQIIISSIIAGLTGLALILWAIL